PIRRRSSRISVSPNRSPKTSTVPALGWRSAARSESVVVLPAPLGPSTTQCSPDRTVQSISVRMRFFSGVQIETSLNSTVTGERSDNEYLRGIGISVIGRSHDQGVRCLRIVASELAKDKRNPALHAKRVKLPKYAD